jgi:hypothetical protein
VKPELVTQSAQIIRAFIEDYHERDEEEYIFPRFRRLLQARAPGSVLLVRLLVGVVFLSEGVQKFLDRHLTLEALDMALRRRCPDAGLVHHSDQGSTYASEDYQRELEKHSITCSMSRKGNCYDNAAMESWFSTLKSELGERFESYGVAKGEVFDYIEVFYDQQRRHSSLGYESPAEHERSAEERRAA